MSKKPSKNDKIKLTQKDASLWERVKATVTPLAAREQEPIEIEDDFASLFEGQDLSTTKAQSSRTLPLPQASFQSTPPSRPTNPMPQTYSHKEKRKLAKGIQKIEATIDLHGLREHEARTALIQFIHTSSHQGKRHLLVITGKGTRPKSHHDDRLFEMEGAKREPGVLRRAVPGWLTGGELGTIVLSYTTAARHHGGEGALYVRLRRKR